MIEKGASNSDEVIDWLLSIGVAWQAKQPWLTNWKISYEEGEVWLKQYLSAFCEKVVFSSRLGDFSLQGLPFWHFVGAVALIKEDECYRREMWFWADQTHGGWKDNEQMPLGFKKEEVNINEASYLKFDKMWVLFSVLGLEGYSIIFSLLALLFQKVGVCCQINTWLL